MNKTLNERIEIIELQKRGVMVGLDGLQQCIHCGAPLQCRKIDSNGVAYIIDVPCRCQELKKYRNKEKIRRECFISPILATYRYSSTFDTKNKNRKGDPHLLKFIRQFSKIKAKGVSVYIYSPSDQTRVFNLARIANGLIDRDFNVKYITVPLFSNLRHIPNADYTELLKKLASFDAIAFADLDLMCSDEKELSFLYGVMSFLVSSNVTLLISSDKHINYINPEGYYGRKIKDFIKKRCVIIPILDEIEEVEIQKIARDELWMFEDEDIANEK